MTHGKDDQSEVMRRVGKFWPLLWVITVLLMSTFLWWSSLPDVHSDIYQASYGSIAVGELLSEVEAAIDNGEFGLVGIFEYENNQPVWKTGNSTSQQVVELNEIDLKFNVFWEALGWTYPKHPLTYKAYVLADLNSISSEYIYLYFDLEDRVAAIYIGYS